MMIELLAAGLVGDLFSFEAKEEDNNDGGPARGGEFIMALSPELIAGKNWNEHAEKFFEQMTSLEGVRLPGQRRHNNRNDKGPREINSTLVEKIKKPNLTFDTMNEIKESFYKHIENGICNGAEYIINYNGKIYQEAIGFKDLGKKIKLPKNLHYRIWSMTKPIVSLAAMQLVEKKFLSLDDTIDKYFPSLNKIKILNKNSKNINDTYLSNKDSYNKRSSTTHSRFYI